MHVPKMFSSGFFSCIVILSCFTLREEDMSELNEEQHNK